jgi:ribonuclease HII
VSDFLEPIPVEWLPAGLSLDSARVAGIDEVGRGALAGPLVGAAVILPPGWIPSGLRDSKRLTPASRERLASEITTHATAIRIEEVEPAEIDRLGIGAANELLFARLLEEIAADFTLIDGTLRVAGARASRCIPQGERFAPVAAASVIAKVHRDRLMAALAAARPGRGFEQAGYPTPANIEAIRRFGRTPQHRQSFRVGALGERAEG